MSWDRYEYDEQSSCTCGKGIVIKHCYCEDDNWNGYRKGHTGIDIQCPECKSKYHYESITQRNPYPEYKEEEFYTSEYLVPNGLKIPEVITARSFFWTYCGRKNSMLRNKTDASECYQRYESK